MRNILYLLCFLQLLSCGSRDNKSEKTYLDSLSFLIQNDSTNTTLLNDRAYFYLNNNNLDLAKQDIDNAFSIFKNDVNILMNRGEVYFQLNQTRISKESWERCLQIDPNNLQCRQKLTELLCIVRDQNCSSMIDTLALLNNGVLDLSLIVYLKELKYYEKGITDKIKKYLTTYTFKSKKELKEAINLWFENQEECIKKYGHISYWDVSNITDMSWLFSYRTDFNEDISRWNVSNVENRPTNFANGFFVDDYQFNDSGALDKSNGRFCKTPDYPDGVYAYFASIDSLSQKPVL